MKKIILILLSLILCFLAFACTAEENDSSITSTESKAENKDESAVNLFDDEATDELPDNGVSSEASVDNSDNSSDSETIVLEFDINNIIYNPDGKHYGEDDIATSWFREMSHHGLTEAMQNTDFSEDSWFCIKLHPCWNSDGTRIELFPYLDEIGFIKDDSLTTSFRQNEYDKSVVGYITKEIFEKLSEDNYAIEYTWFPKSCVDAGGCHKVTE